MGGESPEFEFDLTSLRYESLVSHRAEIHSDATVHEAVLLCQSRSVDSLAVFDDGGLIGLWSREQLSAVLGTQFGFALLAKKRVHQCLRPDPMILRNGQPLEPFLKEAMSRPSERFQEPVILLDEVGEYLGIISLVALARLQSRILTTRLDELRASNETLAMARDEAEAHSRAKSAFLSTISHELLTPMNGVLGFLQLLQDTTLNPDQRDFVQTAQESGGRLLEILTGILTFTQLESSRLVLARVPCRLDLLVQRVQANLLSEALAKGVGLRSETLSSFMPELFCDSERIAYVLGCLVGNAIKFSSGGEVVIRLSIASENLGRTDARFEISDQGVGIPAEQQPLLFAPFTQGDSSLRRRHGGLGMGLVISQKLVTLMGGKIEFESQPPYGSRFWFTLFLSEVEASTANPADGFQQKAA